MDKKMPLRELADHFGVHTSAIAEWESGRKNPKPEFYPKMIRFLGLIPFRSQSKSDFHTFEFYRLTLGYSRKDVSKIIGFSTDVIHRYERDKHHLISRKARTVCDEGFKLFKQQFIDQNFNTYEVVSTNKQ